VLGVAGRRSGFARLPTGDMKENPEILAEIMARVSDIDERLGIVTERVVTVTDAVSQHDVAIETLRSDVRENMAAWGHVKHELRRELVTLRRVFFVGSLIIVALLFRAIL
jgi:hypothetical protein